MSYFFSITKALATCHLEYLETYQQAPNHGRLIHSTAKAPPSETNTSWQCCRSPGQTATKGECLALKARAGSASSAAEFA